MNSLTIKALPCRTRRRRDLCQIVSRFAGGLTYVYLLRCSIWCSWWKGDRVTVARLYNYSRPSALQDGVLVDGEKEKKGNRPLQSSSGGPTLRCPTLPHLPCCVTSSTSTRCFCQHVSVTRNFEVMTSTLRSGHHKFPFHPVGDVQGGERLPLYWEINWGLLCTLVDKLKVFKGFLYSCLLYTPSHAIKFSASECCCCPPQLPI